MVKCDAEGHFDLASRGLAEAVTSLAERLGDKARPLAEEWPRGAAAYRRAEQGFTLSRAELRSLAEFENALEGAAPCDGLASISPQNLQEMLVQAIQSLSPPLPTRLASTTGKDLPDSLPKVPFLWAAITAACFLGFIGIAALPAATMFGGIAWAVAGTPLACTVLLAYAAWARWRQN